VNEHKPKLHVAKQIIIAYSETMFLYELSEAKALIYTASAFDSHVDG
jgi:hypothetical protein